MRPEGGLGGGKGMPGLLRKLLIATFADLGALLLVVLAHASLSAALLVSAAGVLALALVLLSVSTAALGAVYAWRAYPSHRRVILFLAGITLVTLLAHAYIIGNPPASDQHAPVTGAVGAQLFSPDKDNGGSPYVSVTSDQVGGELAVTASASGSEPIVITGVNASTKLSGPGFSGLATFQSPLQPGQLATGTWNVTGTVTAITVDYQSLNCYSKPNHEYGCIMDEIFYVPEGMGILAGQHCTTGAGAPTDCHLEHPPLTPALLAAGMAVLGEYNSAGWRLMPALLGTLSIPLVFGMAWKVSGEKKLAYLSSALLALDVMFFSQSSAGLLDVPEVFFTLAAFFAYFVGLKVWKLDRYVIAGVLLGVAGLAKETAVFAVLALATFVLFFGEGDRWTRLYSVIKVVLVVGLVFAAGLQVYDSALTTSQYPTFVQNVSYILSYGSSLIANKLACQPTTGYWCKFPNDAGGPPILPTDWLLYYSPVAYYATSVCPNSVNGVCQGGSYVAIAYYGVTNLLETWTVYVWVPLVAYAIYTYFRRRAPSLEEFGFQPEEQARATGETKYAAFTLTLFLWSYVPYVFLFLAGRVTYPFYVIPAIPAMAMGAAYWISRSWFPRWLMWIYLAMVVGFFLVYFPDKAFLPQWLRILIGH